MKKGRRSSITVLAWTFAACIVIAGCGGGGDDNDSSILLPNETLLVTQVIDGDTLVLEDGTTVELIGTQLDDGSKGCVDDALARTRQLVEGKQASIRICGREAGSAPGQVFAFVSVNGINVSLVLLQEGLAAVSFVSPCSTEDQVDEALFAAQAQAVAAEIGIWGDGC